jgi:hypothetical protein
MKNPRIEIPSKSPCTNFQRLEKFQNSFKIPNRIFYLISAHLARRPTGMCGPAGPPGRHPILPPLAALSATPACHPPLRHG